ncbi:MAG: COX15/CtaA family protein [Deltaproteobacteria bacterium]|nr:COX15/CtaA family protein [Deltaproteobacteria bacterium]
MKILNLFQFAVCIILFGLIVLGAGVRLADAGLSCPDWPLCYGKVIPVFDTKIFLEWFHRVIAGLIGILALGLTISFFVKKNIPSSVRKLSVLSLTLFFVQAFLGQQTVIQLLRGEIVAAHLIGGYLLFAVNLFILFRLKIQRVFTVPLDENRLRNLRLFFTTLSFVAIFQATLGGVVSSHYAGLVCPDFPTCYGSWWPGFSGLIGIQFTHRLTAFVLLFASFIGAGLFLRRKVDQTIGKSFYLLMFLLSLQIIFGASMIFQKVHPFLSLLHSATSLAIFTTLLVGTNRVWFGKNI